MKRVHVPLSNTIYSISVVLFSFTCIIRLLLFTHSVVFIISFCFFFFFVFFFFLLHFNLNVALMTRYRLDACSSRFTLQLWDGPKRNISEVTLNTHEYVAAHRATVFAVHSIFDRFIWWAAIWWPQNMLKLFFVVLPFKYWRLQAIIDGEFQWNSGFGAIAMWWLPSASPCESVQINDFQSLPHHNCCCSSTAGKSVASCHIGEPQRAYQSMHGFIAKSYVTRNERNWIVRCMSVNAKIVISAE